MEAELDMPWVNSSWDTNTSDSAWKAKVTNDKVIRIINPDESEYDSRLYNQCYDASEAKDHQGCMETCQRFLNSCSPEIMKYSEISNLLGLQYLKISLQYDAIPYNSDWGAAEYQAIEYAINARNQLWKVQKMRNVSKVILGLNKRFFDEAIKIITWIDRLMFLRNWQWARARWINMDYYG